MTRAVDPNAYQFDCRPQAIEKWLENLPRASIGRTSEMLYKALQDINNQKVKAADRFHALERLSEVVHYATDNMRKHFSGLAYPLPDKTMMIASACQSLYDYMGRGYKKVFHELQKQSFLFVDKKMLTTALYRNITYLNRSLLVAYEIYSAYHNDYWEQLHELYQYAEIHKLARQTVSDDYLSIRKKSTIEDEYLRACLLFIAEPYHLRPGEIAMVNQDIEHWYNLTTIQNVLSKEDLLETGRLLVELDKDHPPLFTGNVPVTSNMEYLRILNVDKLVQQLKKDLQEHIEKQRGQQHPVIKQHIGIGLLQRLIDSWGHGKRRRYPRQQVFDKVNVTIGLHNTHMQLMYEMYSNDAMQMKSAGNGFKKPKYQSIDIKAVNTEASDVWMTVYAWAANNASNMSDQIVEDESDVVETRVKQDNWTLLNESANGFALMTVEKQASKVQVGEIISLQRQGATTRQIGIVRWLKAYGNTGVEIGGMYLAPSAIPVGLYIGHSHDADKVVNRGLLISAMPSLSRPESILTFSRHFRTNDVIKINQPGQEKDAHIKLTRHLADNETISQFAFERENEKLVLHNPDESSAELDLSRYKDVWRNI